jgi:hypothetical protein
MGTFSRQLANSIGRLDVINQIANSHFQSLFIEPSRAQSLHIAVGSDRPVAQLLTSFVKR